MTPHEIFGIHKYFTDEELKKRYAVLVQEHHPDKGGDNEKFIQIQEAYEALKKLPKRKETLSLSLYTTDEDLVEMLGKNVLLSYQDIPFEVFIPHRARVGDTVKVENIIDNVDLSLKIKGLK